MLNEILTTINYLALVVSAFAYFFLGELWYSKMCFGATWAGIQGIKMEDNPDAKKGMGAIMAKSLILNLIISFGLAVMVYVFSAHDIMSGLKLGLLCSICFSAATISMSYVYLNKPSMLYIIDCGYHIVGITLSSVILSIWR